MICCHSSYFFIKLRWMIMYLLAYRVLLSQKFRFYTRLVFSSLLRSHISTSLHYLWYYYPTHISSIIKVKEHIPLALKVKARLLREKQSDSLIYFYSFCLFSVVIKFIGWVERTMTKMIRHIIRLDFASKNIVWSLFL